MTQAYDKYYQQEHLFGAPHQELMAFFAQQLKGAVLDVGCGQGRNAIPLAKMGFSVVGIDSSPVGIAQMENDAKGLSVTGRVADMYALTDVATYDYILFDSMFHFAKKDKQKEKETELIARTIAEMKQGATFICCIQDTGSKVQVLQDTLKKAGTLEKLAETKFIYEYKDSQSGHSSKTNYYLVAMKK